MAATIVIAACGDNPEKHMQDLPRVPRAEAMRMANEYANRTVELVGGEAKLENPGTLTPPCDSPGGVTSEKVYYAAGHYNIAPIPEERQLTTLQRLRDQFREQGYTIKQDRVFPDGKRGELAVVNPADEFEIRMQSTSPATAFALSISSPCYYSDESDPISSSRTTTDEP